MNVSALPVCSQVSLSHEDLQVLGTAITMVTQDGTTITVPAHQEEMDGVGEHTVTMVTGDGKELQPVRPARIRILPESPCVTECIMYRDSYANGKLPEKIPPHRAPGSVIILLTFNAHLSPWSYG